MTEDMIVNKCEKKEPYESLYKLNLGLSLNETEAYNAMKSILNIKDKDKRTILMTMLLNGIMVKNPNVSEVKGLLKASLELDDILNSKSKLNIPNNDILIGLSGSGKKGFKTINISTPSAIIAATNGAHIIKACSASTSSKTGSSDFLSILGIDINKDNKLKEEILNKTGIMFFSIEKVTPKFAEKYEGIFYAPHAMSFALAALSFPYKVDVMTYGLSHPNVNLSVEVLKEFGFKNAFVYSSTEDGIHYLDELGVSGFVNVIGIKNGKIGEKIMAPIKKEFGLNETYTNEQIGEGISPEINVAKAIKALKGEDSQAIIDAICINSAILLCLSKKASSLKDGYRISLESIKSGEVFKNFIKIVEYYGGSRKTIERLLGENNE